MMSDDIPRGVQCSGCPVRFKREHGCPVLCCYCWERGVWRIDHIPLATEPEARARRAGEAG